MKKKVLGIAIPYYKNSEECEIKFKELMQELDKQLTEDMILYIYEDGQFSNWLRDYSVNKPNIIHITSSTRNKGVSVARNKCLEYLLKKVLYIIYIDSDDMVSPNYLRTLYEYCADNSHDIIETNFDMQGQLFEYKPKVKRSGVAGSAFKTEMVGDLRFDETIQIGEDTKFMNELVDFTKHRKKHCNTTYYYQFGVNPNSLTKSYQQNKIGKEYKNGRERVK